MATKLVVIGAGPGGYMAAIRAAQLGADVTVIEKGPTGGVCLNWGCIPTKALKATAEALDLAKSLESYGLRGGADVGVDMPAAIARKDGIVQTLVTAIEKLFKAYKIQLIHGLARLEGPGVVAVEADEGGQQINYDRLIIASGSGPADLPGLERDGQHFLDSTDAMNLLEVPESLAIVGGGVIGCEFAGIYASLGSQVTVIEALDRLLPMDSIDPDTSKTLQREFKKRGVKAITGAMVTSATIDGGMVTLELGPSTLAAKPIKKPQQVQAAKVLVSVGRKLNTEGMGLVQAGVELDQRGAIIVDEHLQTSLPGVYAIGDCLGVGRPLLAHMAGAEAKVAVANALGASETVNYDVVPSAIFTTPEAASVGLTAEQAVGRGIEVNTGTFMFRQLGKSQAMGHIDGHVKLIGAAADGRLLGAHIIGPHATDLIHECALALQTGATVEDIAHMIHAHPTLSEGVAEAAESLLGVCLHAPPVK